jgi:hypothetical protein
MKRLGISLGLLLAACQGGTRPATLEEVSQAVEWQGTPGAEADATFNKLVRRILMAKRRAESITAMEAAGYVCTYGEAHENYPEPAAVCTRSFATRACQMDWEIMITSDPRLPGKVQEAAGSFTRDCVGLGNDWPEPHDSAIDDQLAPAPPPN